MSTNVWVGGLPDGVDDETFASLFSNYGTIVTSKCVADKWYGFITFSTAEEAANVVATLDGAEFGGRTLKVKFHEKGAGKGGDFAKGGKGDMMSLMGSMMANVAGSMGSGIGGGGKGDYGQVKGGWKGDYGPYAGGDKGCGAKGGLFKTKMCNYFSQFGTCTNGDSCRFAHGDDELSAAGPGAAMGKGSGFDGLPRGNLTKTKMCKFWEQQGACTNGETCQFAHGAHELVAGGAPSPTGGKGGGFKAKMCTFFEQSGMCKNGDNCTYAHSLEEVELSALMSMGGGGPGGGCGDGSLTKTKMCTFFEQQGFCKHGDGCKFAHGPHELQASPFPSGGKGGACAAGGAICSSQEGLLAGKRADYTTGEEGSNLYVKGLPQEADALYLYKIFAPLGSVMSTFVKDSNTGGRIGFVTYHTAVEAAYAISQVSGAFTVQGEELHVSVQIKKDGKGKGKWGKE